MERLFWRVISWLWNIILCMLVLEEGKWNSVAQKIMPGCREWPQCPSSPLDTQSGEVQVWFPVFDTFAYWNYFILKRWEGKYCLRKLSTSVEKTLERGLALYDYSDDFEDGNFMILEIFQFSRTFFVMKNDCKNSWEIDGIKQLLFIHAQLYDSLKLLASIQRFQVRLTRVTFQPEHLMYSFLSNILIIRTFQLQSSLINILIIFISHIFYFCYRLFLRRFYFNAWNVLRHVTQYLRRSLFLKL